MDTSTLKDGVRCYMTAEGALVCEKLEPGNYRQGLTVLWSMGLTPCDGLHWCKRACLAFDRKD